MRRMLSACVLLGSLAVSAAAFADTFNFSATGAGGGFSGSGTLTATNQGNGTYLINSISGSGITGLIGPLGFNNNDDLLYSPAAAPLDSQGFSFTDTQGNTSFQVNISETAGAFTAFLKDNDGFTETIPVTFALTPSSVPEPSSFVLLGTGLLGAAGMVRRRFLKA